MSFVPLHPFAMRTVFTRCILANFALEPAALAKRLPAHLTPELHEGRAYLSIVIADMEKMRPAFLPKFLGITYNQVVYRAVVRCGSERGVAFLRSDTDNRLMVGAGNALTFFRFHRAEIGWIEDDRALGFFLRPVDGAAASIDATYALPGDERLPTSSRFSDLESAQRFLSELYVAFGNSRRDGRVEVVRIARTLWESRVLHDEGGVYDAMSSGLLFDRSEATLDSVFLVRNLRYRWDSLSLELPRA